MSTEETVKQEVNELATLLIPVEGQNLILPNVSVAEILDYQAPASSDDAPNWYLGLLTWRMLDVPLVSFEGLNGQPIIGGEGQMKIAIMNGVCDSERMPFWGMVTQGTPRLMRVTASELQQEPGAPCGPAELMAVSLAGDIAHIPNTDFMEGELLKLGQF